MEEWNLYILFGVGGGLFTFFSSCFCYYKRKDVIRRKAEKIYENERDQNFASALTQSSTKIVSSVSSSNRSTGSTPLEPEDEQTAAAVRMTIVNDVQGGEINPAFETTKL